MAENLVREALFRIDQFGPWGPLAFIIFFLVANIFFLPMLLLMTSGGVLFGFSIGSFTVSIAATVSAAIAFMLGRYFFRDWVLKKIETNAKMKAVHQAIGKEGWKLIVLLRLAPLFPFNVLNAVLGVTKISFREYIFATWIGMLPGVLVNAYLGTLAGDIITAEKGKPYHPQPIESFFLALTFAAMIVAGIYAGRVVKKALSTV
jgi:uncharacterized membrane protein YdjX (TVP38/TMEM64 family)